MVLANLTSQYYFSLPYAPLALPVTPQCIKAAVPKSAVTWTGGVNGSSGVDQNHIQTV